MRIFIIITTLRAGGGSDYQSENHISGVHLCHPSTKNTPIKAVRLEHHPKRNRTQHQLSYHSALHTVTENLLFCLALSFVNSKSGPSFVGLKPKQKQSYFFSS